MARKSRHVRLFLNVAKARLEEAGHLRESDYTMGAVYLAGYAVECGLKALVLACWDEHEQPDVIAGFRGRSPTTTTGCWSSTGRRAARTRRRR